MVHPMGTSFEIYCPGREAVLSSSVLQRTAILFDSLRAMPKIITAADTMSTRGRHASTNGTEHLATRNSPVQVTVNDDGSSKGIGASVFNISCFALR